MKGVKNHANFIDNKLVHDGHALPGRAINIRHHLGRTTGLNIEDGALLPSPTRDKLMPTIPKSKDDESYNSQRGSPKKTASSRHGSPQKGSPQKQPVKKTIKQSKGNPFGWCNSMQFVTHRSAYLLAGRSQSVGPTSANESSPKRQVRSGSAVPATANTANKDATKSHKKTPVSTPTIVERRPRPSKYSATLHRRLYVKP